MRVRSRTDIIFNTEKNIYEFKDGTELTEHELCILVAITIVEDDRRIVKIAIKALKELADVKVSSDNAIDMIDKLKDQPKNIRKKCKKKIMELSNG